MPINKIRYDYQITGILIQPILPKYPKVFFCMNPISILPKLTAEAFLGMKICGNIGKPLKIARI
jgi:hypothetical protein